MSVLLQHEKRESSSADAVKSVLSRRDSDSNSSDEETKQEAPSKGLFLTYFQISFLIVFFICRS